MANFPEFFSSNRKYMEYQGKEYLVDLVRTRDGGFKAFLTDINTGEIHNGYH